MLQRYSSKHVCDPVYQATERQDVRFYYGTHSEAMTPFQQEAAAWEGVQMVNVYSTDGKGYVQVGCLCLAMLCVLLHIAMHIQQEHVI